MRERARVRAVIGEGDGKVGKKEKESGGGSEEGGVNEGRKDCRWKMKVEQRMKKGKTRIGKVFTLCTKGSAGKNEGVPSKNRPKSDPKRGKTRKKWASQGKKRDCPLKKRPESGSKRGKARKTEILERKRRGGGEAKKWALLPILQCYEVAKSVQMKFSRIFFR